MCVAKVSRGECCGARAIKRRNETNRLTNGSVSVLESEYCHFSANTYFHYIHDLDCYSFQWKRNGNRRLAQKSIVPPENKKSTTPLTETSIARVNRFAWFFFLKMRTRNALCFVWKIIVPMGREQYLHLLIKRMKKSKKRERIWTTDLSGIGFLAFARCSLYRWVSVTCGTVCCACLPF